MMSISLRCLTVPLFALLAFAPPLRAGDDLETRIKQVIGRSEYKHSRWGLLVVDADSGKPLFQTNPDQFFAPASVTKLFTCAAAFLEFGADYRFQPPV